MTMRTILIALALVALPAAAQRTADDAGKDKAVDAAERKAVLDGVLDKISKNYVFPDVAKKMEAALRDRQAKGDYDGITSGKEFAKALTTHLREVCKDKHLRVDCFPEPLPKDVTKGPSPAQQERAKRFASLRNYGFKKVERLDGGVGVLDLEGFQRAESIGETAAAAMTFLSNSEAVIVDLRRNGGGDPAAVILLCSYFFDKPTHLNDIYNRTTDSTRQYWSHPILPGKKLADKDLYVLTSNRTFSGAEEFAYNMQAQKRATLIGETTGGGAHPTTGYRVTDHFGCLVPFARSINPVTKTNWEGTGVKPDVAVPADQALLTAHLIILKKSASKYADDPDAAAMTKRLIAEKEKELEALKAKTDKKAQTE